MKSVFSALLVALPLMGMAANCEFTARIGVDDPMDIIEFQSEDTYSATVQKTPLKDRIRYDLFDGAGRIATCLAREFHVGSHLFWYSEMEVLDTEGKRIGKLETYVLKGEVVHIHLLQDDGYGQLEQLATWEVKPDVKQLYMWDSSSDRPIARLDRFVTQEVDTYWVFRSEDSEAIDDRLLRISGAFILEQWETFFPSI